MKKAHKPARRRHATRRRKSKLQLKQGTVYAMFAIGLLVGAGILILSFFQQEGTALTLTNQLSESFGWTAALFPLLLIFFAFLLLRLKWYLSRLNVSVGYLLFFISLLGLTKSGTIGQEMFRVLEEILTTKGADLVFIGGLLVGNIVFFDTSIDEIFQMLTGIGRTMLKLVPLKLFQGNGEEKGLDKSKPMMIKGGQKDLAVSPNQNQTAHPIIQNNKPKDQLIGDKLVSNVLKNNTGIWEYPPLSLLSESPGKKAERGDIKKTAADIEKTLTSFGIDARVVEVNLGPAVTQYALEIALGTKVNKVTSLAPNLALATEAPGGQIRIEAPIPGRNLIGIEIPNRSLEVVTLKTMLASPNMQKSKSKLTVSLGLDVSGNPLVADISKMPHVLVAGTTGSGKSVLINAFITSLLFRASAQEVKLILVDPKRVEFTAYNGIPHLLTPVIVEPEKILSALKWAMSEMDRRYKLFAERSVRNIEGYNELSGFQALPYIVIVVDELADLMMFAPVEVEDAIARLAQMARATGIHLVIATQRPSVNVITGLIKANIPARIAFNVSSMIDSRVILDSPGAEKLLGRGDMLFIPPEQAKATRIQGAFVSEKEVKSLVDFLKSKNQPVEYTEEVITQSISVRGKNGAGNFGTSSEAKDGELDEAIGIVSQFNQASASFLQRKMSIGYSKAARILDQLEEMNLVGPSEGSKPREVLSQNIAAYLQERQDTAAQ